MSDAIVIPLTPANLSRLSSLQADVQRASDLQTELVMGLIRQRDDVPDGSAWRIVGSAIVLTPPPSPVPPADAPSA